MITDLVAYLKADSGLTALIGTRISPNILPEESLLPALVYQVIDAPRTHYEPSGTFDGFNHPRVQFKAWGTTYASALAVADALKAALEGFHGTLMGGTWINGILPDNELDDLEGYGTARLFCRIVDCVIMHN